VKVFNDFVKCSDFLQRNHVTNLGIGSNETLYGNYTVTQADIDNNGNGTGFIINNATVVCDQKRTATNATATTPITSCTIVKTVTDVTGDGNGNVTAAGDIISYQINVNDTAGMDLTNVTVTDPLLGGLLNVTDLGIGSNETLYENYTVTQADIDNNGNGTGFIINNATVASDQLGPKNATATTPVKSDPNYSIVNYAISPDNKDDCIPNSSGDEIPYTIAVKNEGNVDLTNVKVTDPTISLTGPTRANNNNDGVLSPGETWVYNGNYILTSDDINNGSVNNIATVVCDQLPEKSSNVDTPIAQNKDLQIYKSVTGIDEVGDHMIDQPGDVINYQIAVKDTGNVDLHNVHVTDSLIPSLSGPTGDITDPDVLKPGETWIYKGDYTVTQADIDNNGDGSGFITNTATVSCNEHSSESSSIQLPIITSVNTQTDTNNVPDNTSGNGSESQPTTTNVQPATSSSSSGSDEGKSGGSIGSASVIGSSSSTTTNTSAAANVTPTETSTPVPEQTVTPANVQTPEPNNTSTPVKQRTPGFEVIGGIVGLLGAVYLYRKR